MPDQWITVLLSQHHFLTVYHQLHLFLISDT